MPVATDLVVGLGSSAPSLNGTLTLTSFNVGGGAGGSLSIQGRDGSGNALQIYATSQSNGARFYDPVGNNDRLVIVPNGALTLQSSGGLVRITTDTTGIGFYNHATVAQPAAPVVLADVIAIIRGCGLSA